MTITGPRITSLPTALRPIPFLIPTPLAITGTHSRKPEPTCHARSRTNIPFAYYGPVLEKSKYRTAGKNYVSVNQKGDMVFDKNHIEYDSAFKVEKRNTFKGQKYKMGFTSPKGLWYFAYLPQPQSNLYSFKTNYPAGLNNPAKNNYLKWAYQVAAWDRLFANGTVTDAGQNKDAWFIIYPEYDNLANWLLTRPDGWYPY